MVPEKKWREMSDESIQMMAFNIKWRYLAEFTLETTPNHPEKALALDTSGS